MLTFAHKATWLSPCTIHAVKRITTHLDEVREIVLKYRDPKTPVGIVQKAGRPGQHMHGDF